MEILSEMRAPTRKDEAWRFTDLSRVYAKGHSTSPLADPAATLDPQLVRLLSIFSLIPMKNIPMKKGQGRGWMREGWSVCGWMQS